MRPFISVSAHSQIRITRSQVPQLSRLRAAEPSCLVHRPGLKWPNFRWLVEECNVEEVIRHYDYVFLPDDDIQMDSAAIDELVSVARARRLSFASPAYDAESDGVWRCAQARAPDKISSKFTKSYTKVPKQWHYMLPGVTFPVH